MRQRVALAATLARLYVGVVLIDRERKCRGHRRRIVGVVYDHMCQQQCDQRIGYAAGLRPGVQIGARSAYLALRDFDPANVSCGSDSERLTLSTTSPEYSRKRKSSAHSATSESGQGTKSLRSSPLRGSKSREAGSELRG